MDAKFKQTIIIGNLSCPCAYRAALFFKDSYNLILFDENPLKLAQIRKDIPSAQLIKCDITSTVDLTNLASLVKNHDGFDYLLLFCQPQSDNCAIFDIYNKVLIARKRLSTTMFPLIKSKGLIININEFDPDKLIIPNIVSTLFGNMLSPNFKQEISAFTKSSDEAFTFAQWGTAYLSQKDVAQWQLKNAKIYNLFTDQFPIEIPVIKKLFIKDSNYLLSSNLAITKKHKLENIKLRTSI